MNEEHFKRLREALDRKDIGIWNKWKYNSSSVNIDLSGIKIYHANLTGADLNEVNRSQAQLQLANFSKAKLFRSNFTGANLGRANLDHAKLIKGLDLFYKKEEQ